MGKELLSLIEDGSFRIVDNLGLVEEGDYKEILKCLRKRFVLQANELQWQFCLQNRSQRSGEALEEFAGELRMLADKSFSSWTAAQRLQLVQDQSIRGVSASSTQLTLIKENPDTIVAALLLAHRHDSVELAHKHLRQGQVRSQALTALSTDDDCIESNALSGNGFDPRIDELSKQVKKLSEEIFKL